MTSTPPSPAPDAQPPADDAPAQHWAEPSPRRSRCGEVLIGPSLGSRYRPGALIGLPIIAALLGSFPGAALQQWRRMRVEAGHDGLLETLLAPVWMQLLAGILLLWALLALWGLVAMVLTRRLVLLDESTGTLRLRQGLRESDRAELSQVRYAVGEPHRDSMALIGIADEDGTERQWVVPFIGWDAESFDGLRLLQSATGLVPAPPRGQLLAEHSRQRRNELHREYARRLGMPWLPEYETEDGLFQRDFDQARREARAAERAAR